ncbi:Usher syndrome type-1G protein-like [Armadillidium vulgare]|nr:Usher syndrome type-1G protein-like [Armadillidium vulgare]
MVTLNLQDPKVVILTLRIVLLKLKIQGYYLDFKDGNSFQFKNQDPPKKGIFSTISKNSLGFVGSNKTEPKVIHSKSVHTPTKFSELTQSSVSSNKKTIGGIQRKLLRKKVNSENKANSFKVRATILQVQDTESDGRKSMRNLSGLQRDSEIIFVPTGSMSSAESESPSAGKRGKISDVFQREDYSESFYGLSRAKSEPDFGDSKFGSQRASIFERPGFGSVAFRNSITATLTSMQGSLSETSDLSRLSSDGNPDTSLDSHGSPAGNRLTPWEEEDLPSDDDEEPSPVYLFLAANGLENYMPLFTKEHIDLEALMLLNDQDLESLKLPLGPRRKLLRALNDRRMTFEDPGEVIDIRL